MSTMLSIWVSSIFAFKSKKAKKNDIKACVPFEAPFLLRRTVPQLFNAKFNENAVISMSNSYESVKS